MYIYSYICIYNHLHIYTITTITTSNDNNTHTHEETSDFFLNTGSFRTMSVDEIGGQAARRCEAAITIITSTNVTKCMFDWYYNYH